MKKNKCLAVVNQKFKMAVFARIFWKMKQIHVWSWNKDRHYKLVRESNIFLNIPSWF